ncbi:hypothetical protein Rsub_02245 [Raphidocelis subcapitata]|uniref:Uncharacterized protein n=1 Tax=Raphidocelis subcapitata TaxID=307507 RepID=A0A2V0NX84_9CHLO|nr:hypothetical protein Rsub_02245 [Raphidocelis subcapitata]|eukprot:GBF89527.1 hypothetical protein Rsub_02245 [Raphidocelis subcapitata]
MGVVLPLPGARPTRPRQPSRGGDDAVHRYVVPHEQQPQQQQPRQSRKQRRHGHKRQQRARKPPRPPRAAAAASRAPRPAKASAPAGPQPVDCEELARRCFSMWHVHGNPFGRQHAAATAAGAPPAGAPPAGSLCRGDDPVDWVEAEWEQVLAQRRQSVDTYPGWVADEWTQVLAQRADLDWVEADWTRHLAAAADPGWYGGGVRAQTEERLQRLTRSGWRATLRRCAAAAVAAEARAAVGASPTVAAAAC